jgi:hypothetical protein
MRSKTRRPNPGTRESKSASISVSVSGSSSTTTSDNRSANPPLSRGKKALSQISQLSERITSNRSTDWRSEPRNAASRSAAVSSVENPSKSSATSTTRIRSVSNPNKASSRSIPTPLPLWADSAKTLTRLELSSGADE